MALTDRTIKAKSKPADKAFKLSDAHGLYLLVKPNGGRYWRMDYRFNGKYRTLSFGVYPEVTLKEARDKQSEARKLLRNDQDPAEVKREAKRKQASQNSFESVTREWHNNQTGKWSADHAKRVLESLEKEAFPYIGVKSIEEITAPMVLDVIRRIERRNALDVASRVLQRIGAVFRYAISTGCATYNPAGDLAGTLKTRKVTHRAALSRSELPEFYTRLENYDGQVLTQLALKLVVLTFVRSRELRGARWEEFDLERKEWRIPAARMKMDNEHIVPLAEQAIMLLDEIRPHTGSFELLFPNQNNLSKPISENTLLYAMYRMGYHSKATVHGFRATASTILNEMGFQPDVIERQLAHVERNKVRAAYNRSEYLADRHKMMQTWADYLDSLKTDSQVVPIHAA